MNRILQFLIFIFWGTLLYAQNVVVDGGTFLLMKITKRLNDQIRIL